MRRELVTRTLWTLWALAPVGVAAYHFGPGQRWYNADRATDALRVAHQAQEEASRLQDAAYQDHLATIAARAAAFGKEDAALHEGVKSAAETEQASYALAGAAWQRTAAALGEAGSLIDPKDEELSTRVRLARARALVRAGDIGTGANELEELVLTLGESGKGDSEMGLQAREEMGTAYYYGARLMRLAGKPSEEWREVSGRARQNFRYLASHARHAREHAGDAEMIANFEKNGELVLNLEQSSLDELYAKARPKDSPPGTGRIGTEPRPGRRGRRRGEQPAGGAGLDGEIGQGW